MRKNLFRTTLILMVIMVGISFDSCKKPKVKQNEITFMGKTYPINVGVIANIGPGKHTIVLRTDGIRLVEGRPVGKGSLVQVILRTGTATLEEGIYNLPVRTKSEKMLTSSSSKMEGYIENGQVILDNETESMMEGRTFSESQGRVTVKRSGNVYEIDFDFTVVKLNPKMKMRKEGAEPIGADEPEKVNLKAYYRGNIKFIDYLYDSMLSFENTKRCEGEMSSDPIIVSSEKGMIFNAGDILIYKTNQGRYGKLRIISIDPADNYRLIAKVTTYNVDGSVRKKENSLIIGGSMMCDLDEMNTSPFDGDTDFSWIRTSQVDAKLVPHNSAKFANWGMFRDY